MILFLIGLAEFLAGSVRVTPSQGTSSPIGAGVLGYSSGGIKVTETGVPPAVPTTHARIFIDQSQGHDTGLAIASADASGTKVSFKAYQTDGSTAAGAAGDPIDLPENGHLARYVGQLVSGLQTDFTGVLDISAPSPFVAVTLRSLKNALGDVLLTTFPIANLLLPAPAPGVFPQLADGGGYTTQFILINSGAASSATIRFYGESGVPLPVGK